MIAALIIAAGRTPRKDCFEPLREVGTITVIERLVQVFQRAGVKRIAVVYDGDVDKAENLASRKNMIYLQGLHDAEMLDNVKIGLEYLRDKCSAALIAHVGVPLFLVETVHTLMETDGQACIPLHNGRAGHPLRLGSKHFQAILSYSGEGGLVEAVKAAGLRRNFVEVSDEGILVNAKDTEEYAYLLSGHSLMEPYPDARIRIVSEKPFYGPGAHQLLQLICETGSVSEACRNMGLSYGKGRAIIFDMEQQLGYRVLESRQGGKTGGYSIVTEKAQKLMKNYSGFSEEAKKSINRLFMKYFKP